MSLIPLVCTVLLQVAPPPTPPQSDALRRATLVYAIAGSLDVASTAAFVLRGGHEGNPLLAPLQKKPVAMLAVGVATSVTGVWAWNHFVGRKHPKLAAVGLYAAAGVHAYFAARNYQLYRERSARIGAGMEPGTLLVARTVAW